MIYVVWTDSEGFSSEVHGVCSTLDAALSMCADHRDSEILAGEMDGGPLAPICDFPGCREVSVGHGLVEYSAMTMSAPMCEAHLAAAPHKGPLL